MEEQILEDSYAYQEFIKDLNDEYLESQDETLLNQLDHESLEEYMDQKEQMKKLLKSKTNFPLMKRFYNKELEFTDKEIDQIYRSFNYLGNNYEKEALIVAKYLATYEEFIAEVDADYEMALKSKNQSKIDKAVEAKKLQLYVEYMKIITCNDLYEMFIANESLFLVDKLTFKEALIAAKHDAVGIFTDYIKNNELSNNESILLSEEIIKNCSLKCFELFKNEQGYSFYREYFDKSLYNENYNAMKFLYKNFFLKYNQADALLTFGGSLLEYALENDDDEFAESIVILINRQNEYNIFSNKIIELAVMKRKDYVIDAISLRTVLESCIKYAIRYNQTDIVDKIIDKYGESIYIQDLLNYAIEEGSIYYVKLFSEQIPETDKLDLCALLEKDELVDFFLEKGETVTIESIQNAIFVQNVNLVEKLSNIYMEENNITIHELYEQVAKYVRNAFNEDICKFFDVGLELFRLIENDNHEIFAGTIMFQEEFNENVLTYAIKCNAINIVDFLVFESIDPNNYHIQLAKSLGYTEILLTLLRTSISKLH